MASKKTPKKPSPQVVETERGTCRIRAVRTSPSRPAGEWYWRADLSVRGEGRTCVWTGWASPAGAARAVAAQIANGDLGAGKEQPRQPGRLIVTVADMLDAWMALSVRPRGNDGRRLRRGDGLAPKSVEAYEGAVARLKQSTLAAIRLDALGIEAVEAYLTGEERRGRSARTVNFDRRQLLAAWRWAEREGYAPPGVRLEVPTLKAESPDDYTPSPVEFKRVLSHVPEGWAHDALTLLGIYGCRVGGIGKLRVCDVNFAKGELTFRNKTAARSLPIRPQAEPILRRLIGERSPQDESRVFPVAETTMRLGLGSKVLAKACAAAGVRYFTARGLRRMVGKKLILSGWPQTAYCEWMGHSIKVAFEHYNAIEASDLARLASEAGLGGGPGSEAEPGTVVVPLRQRA